ncbi:PREDICTED: uncharacterized protein LOC108361293, partial [Rhagoletis zephyria]|uniref:uncharacterized protein LOC108361293 n=1 Tax=Rhagoletis zephyria TaxID=28612 RepID=UPI0008119981
KCELIIKEETEDSIECDKCAKKFHSQCTKLDKRQFQQLLENESEMFVCHLCNGGGEMERDLKEIKTKLIQLDQLSEIQKSMTFMSVQYDEILKGVIENKKKLSEVEKENLKLRREVNDLKLSVKMLNDGRVKNDCIVSGLKVSDGATAVESVLTLTKNAGVDVQREHIEDAFFLPNNKPTNGKKTVVVKFSNKSAKDKMMASKSKLKDNPATNSVFINDFLSKETLILFNYAKALKNIGYRSVYVRGGRVMYKRSEISRPQIIRSEEDVKRILLEATTTKSSIL